jgi:hypothetical protein
MEAAMDPVFPSPDHGLAELRQQRAELREAMSALEQALAAPTPGRLDSWVERVHVALVELSADFDAHVEITEGPEGLYRGVRTSPPRMSMAVERLTREHVEINRMVADLVACVSTPATADSANSIRELGTALLARLIRHRQRGADLVYEAYDTDIGGET